MVQKIVHQVLPLDPDSDRVIKFNCLTYELVRRPLNNELEVMVKRDAQIGFPT